MNERQALAWLGRKIAWGFDPDGWVSWHEMSVAQAIDRLVDPDTHAVSARPDPFAGIEVEPDMVGRALAQGVRGWVDAAVATPRPLETFIELFWGDFFAVSARSVRPPTAMFRHVGLLAEYGLGNFGDLLREVTLDPAMLQFLDGATSTAGNPNENYGRELLELYSVGVGNFTEADVKAAATALTGWTLRRFSPDPIFRPPLHDSTPQSLLGADGVHDVDTVIAAVVAHPGTAERVVGKLATAILGPGYDVGPTAAIVDRFGDDLELRPVVRSLLEMGVDGAAMPALLEPIPWLVAAARFTGVVPGRESLRDYFRTSGQTPLLPPTVGGYPEPDAYLSTSATIARFNLASGLAERARPVARRASTDVDRLGEALGLADGFAPATHDALESLPAGPGRIAAALASPDLLVV